jgi:hypothetical protein
MDTDTREAGRYIRLCDRMTHPIGRHEGKYTK